MLNVNGFGQEKVAFTKVPTCKIGMGFTIKLKSNGIIGYKQKGEAEREDNYDDICFMDYLNDIRSFKQKIF